MPTPARPARVSVAIRRPEDEAILVLVDGSLPSFEAASEAPWQVVEPVNDAMRSRGLSVTTLRAAWVSADLGERLYEAVLTDGRVAGRWTERSSLEAALDPSVAGPDLVAAVGSGALTPSDGALQPWYSPGWLDGMTRWIEVRLAEAGLRRTAPIRQMRSWGRSALLRVETDRGTVWAKEVPAAFAHEIAVTGLLADLDPGLVPPLIAVDPAAGRLLTAHVDGPMLTDVSDRAAWTATLARLAETQRVLGAERDRLVVAGVASAQLSGLAEAVPGLLADRALLRVGLEGGLSERDWSSLGGHADALVAACHDLAASGVPDSLDHGDLSASQVIVGDMGPVILDWSDATITHPFLALAAFDADAAGTAAYVATWGAAVDPAVAGNAVESARLVEPMHLARSYRDRILPGLEHRWEMDRVVPAHLARLLRVLERDRAGSAR